MKSVLRNRKVLSRLHVHIFFVYDLFLVSDVKLSSSFKLPTKIVQLSLASFMRATYPSHLFILPYNRLNILGNKCNVEARYAHFFFVLIVYILYLL